MQNHVGLRVQITAALRSLFSTLVFKPLSLAAKQSEIHPPGTLLYPIPIVQTVARNSELLLCLRSGFHHLLNVLKVDRWQKSLESQNTDTLRKAFFQGCEYCWDQITYLDLVVHMALISMLTSPDQGSTEMFKKLVPVVTRGKEVPYMTTESFGIEGSSSLM